MWIFLKNSPTVCYWINILELCSSPFYLGVPRFGMQIKTELRCSFFTMETNRRVGPIFTWTVSMEKGKGENDPKMKAWWFSSQTNINFDAFILGINCNFTAWTSIKVIYGIIIFLEAWRRICQLAKLHKSQHVELWTYFLLFYIIFLPALY